MHIKTLIKQVREEGINGTRREAAVIGELKRKYEC